MRYIVNKEILGFNNLDINNIENVHDNDLVLILVSNHIDNIKDYYKSIRSMVTQNTRVILISLNDTREDIEKPLFNLLASYGKYDIYKIDDEEVLDIRYANAIIDREPQYTEVAQFIGGDIIAYANMSKLAITITELIEQENIEKLVEFVESNTSSIVKFSQTLDYMKTVVDNFNTGDLIEQIDTKEQDLIEKSRLLSSIQDSLQSMKEQAELTSSKNLELENTIKELKRNSGNLNSQANGVIKEYKKVDTRTLSCTTFSILYFKELSYVRYTNSLITSLMKCISVMEKQSADKRKVKLVIYDSASLMARSYHPLPVIKGNDYLANRDNYSSRIEKLVVAEPNQIILEDIVTSSDKNDVVIIYDRLRQPNELIAGNNVSKFYVTNSVSEYKTLKDTLRISNSDTLIVGDAEEFNKEISNGLDIIDIPKINEYSLATESGKVSKFTKHVSSNGKSIVSTILQKARLTNRKD